MNVSLVSESTPAHVARALRLTKEGGLDKREPSNAWFFETTEGFREVYLEGPIREAVSAGHGLPYSFSAAHCG